MTAAEQWVQPAILTTLVYRAGAAGAGRGPPQSACSRTDSVFSRRASVLAQGGGYAPARASFSDDVTLARDYATRAAGALGSRWIAPVCPSALTNRSDQMWREWGRSIDLRDSTRPYGWRSTACCWFSRQALPLPLLIAIASGVVRGAPNVVDALVAINAAFVLIRVLILGALAGSYERPGVAFWLSPLADIAAVFACCCPPSAAHAPGAAAATPEWPVA
jgi:dolichol-phosphate mannosyltransferase